VTSPSSIPRVVVVGCGYWGRNLVRNFHALDALAAVVDATPAGRKLAGELAPGVEVVDALEPLLARRDFQAVALATPAVTHAPLGLKVLGAGKDLFVEKPMAMTVAEGRAMVELAERNGRILQVGHVLEYHPAVPILRQWITSGKLGRLRRLHSHRLNFGKVRTEEDALWNVAPHDFAVMLRITGWMPKEVSCFASYSLGTPRADFAIAMLRFPEEIDAHVFAGWLHPTKEQRLVAVGDRGTAVFDDAAPLAQKLTFYDQHVDFKNGQPELFKGAAQPETLPADEPLRLECAAFVESIVSRRPPLSDGRSGLRVLSVLEACRRSMEAGGKIESVLAL
jgi:predicted dehydrogenase